MKIIYLILPFFLTVCPVTTFAENSKELKEIRKQTYWYGYSWGIISQTCLFYIDGEIDLETAKKEVSAGFEIVGVKAPGYIETILDAVASPEFKKCEVLLE